MQGAVFISWWLLIWQKLHVVCSYWLCCIACFYRLPLKHSGLLGIMFISLLSWANHLPPPHPTPVLGASHCYSFVLCFWAINQHCNLFKVCKLKLCQKCDRFHSYIFMHTYSCRQRMFAQLKPHMHLTLSYHYIKNIITLKLTFENPNWLFLFHFKPRLIHKIQ